MTEVRNPELEGIQVDTAEGNGHLRLSDKPEFQQVNEDDLLSQISDICGEDLSEPKLMSLDSISVESFPNSNIDSSDQLPLIDEDEEMTLLEEGDDLNPEQASNVEESNSKTSKDSVSPMSTEDDIIEANILANGDEPQSNKLESINQSESNDVETEKDEFVSRDGDSEIQQVEDTETKDSLPKDDDSGIKTAIEEDSNLASNQTDKIDTKETDKVGTDDVVDQPAEIVEEPSSADKKLTEAPEEKNDLEKVSNHQIIVEKHGNEDILLEEHEVDSIRKPEENKPAEDVVVAVEDEVVAIEDSEADIAKMKEAEKRKRLSESLSEDVKESESKRRKSVHDEDSDDNIEFFAVSSSKPATSVPETQTPNEDSDDEIIFYNVPSPKIGEDDDIQIIEDTSKVITDAKSADDKESKKEELVEIESSVKKDEVVEVTKVVPEKKVDAVEETAKMVSEPEKKETTLDKEAEDSDDDIMIVEDDHPIVSLTEDGEIEKYTSKLFIFKALFVSNRTRTNWKNN